MITIPGLPTYATLGAGNEPMSLIDNGFTAIAATLPNSTLLYGAKANGSTDDSAAINAALASSSAVQTMPGTSLAVSAITVPTGQTFYGESTYLSKINGALILTTGVEVRSMTVEGGGSSTIPISVTANTQSVMTVRDCAINTTGYAVSLTGESLQDFDLVGCNIAATGYGFLASPATTPTGGGNIRVMQSIINSDGGASGGDAVELNYPGCTASGFIVSDNFLIANGTASSAGFAVGMAGAIDVLVFGNVMSSATQETVHIEDSSKGVVVAVNTITPVNSNGVVHYNHASNGAPIFLGNQVTSGTSGSNSGIFMFSTTTGTKSGAVISANAVSGFNYGLNLGSINLTQATPATVTLADGNTITACNVAVSASGNGGIGECRQYGTNLASGCTYLFEPQAGHYSFGKCVSDTAIGGVIERPSGGYSGYMPSSCDGFAGLVNLTYPYNLAAASNTIPMISGTGAFYGRCVVKGMRTGTTDWVIYSATILLTAGTLTTISGTGLALYGTNFSGASFSITNAGSNNILNLVLTSAGVSQLNSLWIDFDGEWYDY